MTGCDKTCTDWSIIIVMMTCIINRTFSLKLFYTTCLAVRGDDGTFSREAVVPVSPLCPCS